MVLRSRLNTLLNLVGKGIDGGIMNNFVVGK